MSDWNEAIEAAAKEVFSGEIPDERLTEFGRDRKMMAARIRKLKRPAPLDGGWMPIESAPKDGTHILVFVSDGYCVEAWWDSKQTNFYKSQEGWASYDPANMRGDWVSHFSDHGTLDARMYCGSTPEYWQPLPAPASPEKAEGER